MFEGTISGYIGEKMFKDNEKNIFKTIKIHALIGGILMAFPEFGFGVIIYIIVLWHMYSSICDKVSISFSKHWGKLIGFGFIVNIIVALILNIVLSVLPILSGFIVYAQFYLSGKFFYDQIKRAFSKPNTNTSTEIVVNKMIEATPPPPPPIPMEEAIATDEEDVIATDEEEAIATDENEEKHSLETSEQIDDDLIYDDYMLRST